MNSCTNSIISASLRGVKGWGMSSSQDVTNFLKAVKPDSSADSSALTLPSSLKNDCTARYQSRYLLFVRAEKDRPPSASLLSTRSVAAISGDYDVAVTIRSRRLPTNIVVSIHGNIGQTVSDWVAAPWNPANPVVCKCTAPPRVTGNHFRDIMRNITQTLERGRICASVLTTRPRC